MRRRGKINHEPHEQVIVLFYGKSKSISLLLTGVHIKTKNIISTIPMIVNCIDIAKCQL